MTSHNRRNAVTGVLFLLLGLIAVAVLIPNGITVPGSVTITALSPDFWPRIVATCIILASIFLLIETRFTKPQSATDDNGPAVSDYPPGVMVLRTLVLPVALFAFYASLTTFGFVATSIVAIMAMMLFFGERRYLLIGVLGIGTPVLLYLFFRYVAGIPIPLGIFGG